MLLDPGEAMFDKVEENFLSPFPSEDSQFDPKFQALQTAADDKTVSETLTVMRQGKAFSTALAIVNKTKATVVGDLLNDWLPRVAWTAQGKTGPLLQGLFAEVPWERLSSLKPDQVVKVMGAAGLNIALTTLAAVPVYGQIAAGLVGAGKLMYRLFDANTKNSVKKLVLPWSEYSRDTDEDLLNTLRDTVFNTTNWAPLFAPPFKLEPWRVAVHGSDEDPKGLIFIPTHGKEPAWSTSGVGCMPGTSRIAGQVQGFPPQLPEAALIRHLMRPKGVSPREVPIFWRQELVACGDYFPSVAQLGAAVWQQVQAAGNPDMYKVQVGALDDAWRAYFENLWATTAQAMADAGGTIGQIVGYDSFQAANLVAQLVEPYLCLRPAGLGGDVDPKTPWQLGVPPGYRPHALFHEKFFKAGPVEADRRNPCLFVEGTFPGPKPGHPFWPYGVVPKEHKDLRAGGFQPNTSPATDAAPLGYRCTPYPPIELAKAQWGSPYDVFIKPQLDALLLRQQQCLETTLVCAYVRPVGYDGLTPYAAFDGAAGEALRTRCLEVREQLLTSEARFLVNLKDVHDLDPKFEAKLRASGVNNSVGQMNAARFKLKAAGAIDGSLPAPEPPPTGGGVAFGDLVGTSGGGGGNGGSGDAGGKGLATVIGALGLALAAKLARSRR